MAAKVDQFFAATDICLPGDWRLLACGPRSRSADSAVRRAGQLFRWGIEQSDPPRAGIALA